MKVGDYVRTKDGIILKVKDIEDIYTTDNIYIGMSIYDNEGHFVNDVEIIKSSPNIIELLEEHDLVVIEYYSLRYKERVTRLFEVDYKDKEFMTLKNAHCDFMLRNNEFNDEDKKLKPIIKSIVTKEMYSSVEYRVETN